MYDDPNQRANSSFMHLLASSLPPAQHYDELEQSPAVAPLEFPTPTLGWAEHLRNITIVDHRTRGQLVAKHLLVPHSSHPTQQQRQTPPNHAFLTKKRMGKSAFGQVRLCVLLRAQLVPNSCDNTCTIDHWETTEELVVVKSSLRETYGGRNNRSILRKNPMDEISALQLVGNYHPHVLGCHEAFQDEEYLYSVLPYCPGKDLYSALVIDHSLAAAAATTKGGDAETSTVSSSSSSTGCSASSSCPSSRPLREAVAREWFCQLLEGLGHLQKKGVCHGGLCLENILVDADGNLVISDFGLSVRIPYEDESNKGGGGVTDVSSGSVRRLMRCQVTNLVVNGRKGANRMYLAPELVQANVLFNNNNKTQSGISPNRRTREECCFDGYAVDLWSLGVLLFVLLTGTAPFHIAHDSDQRFVMISKRGGLRKLLQDLDLSSSAKHLLQSMLWADPADRLTLNDLLLHPWVSPPDVSRCGSFDSLQDNLDQMPSKKQFHHLSFVDGGDGTLDRGKVLKAEERMASF